MLKNGKTTKKAKHLNLKWVCLFSCALIVCMVATFSITMAYFGGSSDSMNASLMIKNIVEVGKTAAQSSVSMDSYMIPGVNILPVCKVTVMSSVKDSSGKVDKNLITNALLRVKVSFSGDMATYLSDSGTDVYFDVYNTATASGLTDSGNIIGRLLKDGTSGYWYLVSDKTATSLSAKSELKELKLTENVNANNYGAVTLMFKMKFMVSSEFTNDSANKTAIATVTFEAVQSEYYDMNTGAKLPNTFEEAQKIFDYDYGD